MRHRWILCCCSLAVGALPGPAPRAQVDCTAASPCVTTKYGLGNMPEYRADEEPPDPFRWVSEDFGPDVGGQSYHVGRRNLGPDPVPCGPERAFWPLPGQVRLREQVDCVPTSEGPQDPDDVSNGGIASGCRVEIPISNGGVSPVSETSELHAAPTTAGIGPGGFPFDLAVSVGNNLGGSSADDGTCLEENVRRRPSMATRYRLPASHPEHDRSGEQTYLRWDPVPPDPLDRPGQSTALRLHVDDSTACCNSPGPDVCGIIVPGLPNYPDLLARSCVEPDRFVHEDRITPDWIFVGGRDTAFYTDPHFEVPGQAHGVCRENRFLGCTRGGGECDVLGDVCDLRERGLRIQSAACGSTTDGTPRPDCCASNLYVLRGTPQQGCSLLTRYVASGDPGPRCRIQNFGVDRRDDADCDGVADFPEDLCPFLSEWDQDLDSDGDCPGPSCRGDECECGDQSGDGRVDVADLLEINATIFDPAGEFRLLCDSNADLACDVEDILGGNLEIFLPGSAVCRQITPLRCGDGNIDADLGEVCDDANDLTGDGCNPACRVEAEWTCAGEPSVCERVP